MLCVEDNKDVHVIPALSIRGQSEDSFPLVCVVLASLWWCRGCGERRGQGFGRGGGVTRIPPSGKTIILQTECHALQTADKKTVTTVGWWRRDRGERENRGRRTVKNKGKNQEKKRDSSLGGTQKTSTEIHINPALLLYVFVYLSDHSSVLFTPPPPTSGCSYVRNAVWFPTFANAWSTSCQPDFSGCLSSHNATKRRGRWGKASRTIRRQ